MDLFGQDLLSAETHRAVFGDLPSSLQQDLRTTEISDLVTVLLDAGWRRGQLATRVAALPAGPDAVSEIAAFLRSLLSELPPDARWREQRAEAAALRSRAEVEEPASDEVRTQWLARIRADLAVPRSAKPAPAVRVRPACALCGEESSFFVTRDVRLCETCVGLLSAGSVRLSEAG